jgi:thiamine-monophosphate kinase
LGQVKELALIAAIRGSSAARKSDAGLVAGIGDDCAILRPRAGEDLLLTTDFLIEDVHFKRRTHKAAEVGWKALARGLSDVAAMGGDARYALLSLALPEWAGSSYVRSLYRGLHELGGRHGVQVIGGDLSRTEKLTLDIVVIGSVPRGCALRRTGARAGDVIYVSGGLGRAAASGYRDRPEPRLELGKKLRGKASACMDLSDGLAMDLHRLCVESGVSAELDGVLPAAPGATLEQALQGGEDYELLCAMPAGIQPPRGLTRVGVVGDGVAGEVRFAGVRLAPRGWDPFGARRVRQARSAACRP